MPGDGVIDDDATLTKVKRVSTKKKKKRNKKDKMAIGCKLTCKQVRLVGEKRKRKKKKKLKRKEVCAEQVVLANGKRTICKGANANSINHRHTLKHFQGLFSFSLFSITVKLSIPIRLGRLITEEIT